MTAVRRLPTRAAFAVSACGAVLILMSGTAQAAWLAVLGALVVGTVAGSVPVRHRLSGAVVEVRAPVRLRVGDEFTLEIAVSAPTHALPVHRLELVGAPFPSTAVLVESVRRGDVTRGGVTVTATTRGVHDAQLVRLSTGAPFGLLRSSAEMTATVQVEVGATLVDLPNRQVRSLTGADDASAERHRGGDEFHAVRDYRSGDAMRDVHWRSTARVGRLVVREYERAVPVRSAVAITGGVPGPAFEALLSAAASIAHRALLDGEEVDLVRAGPAGRPIARWASSEQDLHSWSAAAEAGAGDLRQLTRDLLARRPSWAVLAVAAGAERVADAGAELVAAGADVLLLTLPGYAGPVPREVVHRVLHPGGDLARTLAGADVGRC